MQFLLERGASISRVNRKNETALFSALNYPDAVRMLLEYNQYNTGMHGSSSNNNSNISNNSQHHTNTTVSSLASTLTTQASSKNLMGSKDYAEMNHSNIKLLRHMDDRGQTVIHSCIERGFILSLIYILCSLSKVKDKAIKESCVNDQGTIITILIIDNFRLVQGQHTITF